MTEPYENSQSANDVLAYALARMPKTIEKLKGYLTVPSISCEKGHSEDVRRLAAWVHSDLQALGLHSRLLELDQAHPLVAAELSASGDARPTVLLYGHLDVQPVINERWTTPPHEAHVHDGRLYARGAADDMGGWVSHMAAIEAWLSVRGSLPVNVKLIIEGEEEVGSPNLTRYMDAYPEAFLADLMVLTDGENPSDEIPGLTVSLRGVFKVEVSCESLEADVHSGLWGNMAPDPGNALVLLLSRLLDERGRMRLGRMDHPEPVRRGLAQVPLSSGLIREAIRAVDGVVPLPLDGRSAAEWLWRQPAVTILSTTLPRPSDHKNAVRARAAATLSIRLAPGQTASSMMDLLQSELLVDPPGGVKVSLRELPGGGQSWLCQPQGDEFEAANRAYEASWGRPLYPIGLGGTIPLVSIFSERYPGVPLILNGVLDPMSGAHGPDESLHLDVFAKTIAATVQLFDELARVGSGPAGGAHHH